MDILIKFSIIVAFLWHLQWYFLFIIWHQVFYLLHTQLKSCLVFHNVLNVSFLIFLILEDPDSFQTYRASSVNFRKTILCIAKVTKWERRNGKVGFCYIMKFALLVVSLFRSISVSVYLFVSFEKFAYSFWVNLQALLYRRSSPHRTH